MQGVWDWWSIMDKPGTWERIRIKHAAYEKQYGAIPVGIWYLVDAKLTEEDRTFMRNEFIKGLTQQPA